MYERRMEVIEEAHRLTQEHLGEVVELNRVNRKGLDVFHRIESLEYYMRLLRRSLQDSMDEFVRLKHLIPTIFDC